MNESRYNLRDSLLWSALHPIAEISESYQVPASNFMRIDGEQAVGIAVSTVPTGNVVDMAEVVKECIAAFLYWLTRRVGKYVDGTPPSA